MQFVKLKFQRADVGLSGVSRAMGLCNDPDSNVSQLNKKRRPAEAWKFAQLDRLSKPPTVRLVRQAYTQICGEL